MFTIEYDLPSGRKAYHSASGIRLTEFLRGLERERIKWRFVDTSHTCDKLKVTV